MGKLIEHLLKSGDVILYQDMRTGSFLDLSHPTRAVAAVGDMRWLHGKNGMGLAYGGGVSGYVATGGVTDFNYLVTGYLVLALVSYRKHFSGANYLWRAVGGSILNIYWTGGTFLATDGTAISVGPSRVDCSTFGTRIVPGFKPTFYVDGASSQGSLALTPTDPITSLWWGINFTSPINAIMCVQGSAVSDADVARLHRELVAGPSVVARPTKHFSIPYPSKTPAEYAAEGIILDMDGGGKELTGTRPTTVVGQLDTSKEGPFAEALSLGGSSEIDFPAADAQMFLSNDWTIGCWIKRYDSADTSAVLSGPSGHHFTTFNTSRMLVATRDAAGSNRYLVFAFGPVNKWTFVTGGRQLVGADLIQNGSVDGVSVTSATYAGAGVQIPAAGQPKVNPGASRKYSLASVAYYDRTLTPAEVRAEYLKGARKCLLDARVHSDGSCPVSLAAVGAGNEIANGWKIQSGTWKVVEDAPSGGRPGKRWLEKGTNGTIFQPSAGAFGSYHLRIKPSAGAVDVMLCAEKAEWYSPSNSGYLLEILNGAVYLFRVTAGAPAVLFGSAASILTYGIEYDFWLERTFQGIWRIWYKAISATTWALIPASSGANPTAVDLTHTVSKYHTAYSNNVHSFGGLAHYLG